MVDKFGESFERWRVPISLTALLGLVLFAMATSYSLAQKEQIVNSRLAQCEASIAKAQADVSQMRVDSSKRDIEYAGLRSDVKYIIQTLEEIKRGMSK